MKYKNKQNQSMVMKSGQWCRGGMEDGGELTKGGYEGVFRGDGDALRLVLVVVYRAARNYKTH